MSGNSSVFLRLAECLISSPVVIWIDEFYLFCQLKCLINYVSIHMPRAHQWPSSELFTSREEIILKLITSLYRPWTRFAYMWWCMLGAISQPWDSGYINMCVQLPVRAGDKKKIKIKYKILECAYHDVVGCNVFTTSKPNNNKKKTSQMTYDGMLTGKRWIWNIYMN